MAESNGSQSEAKPTFDKLPIEMIREILLRLNDYRDLINSAQASPVMRTMINSQHIWQKLCRYHFTEQQLKLALESRDFSLARKSSLRSIKYARTVSADGRSSYRNRVSHNQSSAARESNAATAAAADQSTTRQQLEQTAGRRGANSLANKPSTSYVTKAIRIFDKGESSTNCDSKPSASKKQTGSLSNSSKHCATPPEAARGRRLGDSTEGADHESSQTTAIDWERVFHQLRK